MIRPYLRNLINERRPTVELNDNTNTNTNTTTTTTTTNNNNNNNDNNNNIKNNNNIAEWNIHLTKQNSCISTKSFEETRTIYAKSEPV